MVMVYCPMYVTNCQRRLAAKLQFDAWAENMVKSVYHKNAKEGIFMEKKSTDELQNILKKASTADIGQYLAENQQNLLTQQKPFSAYMHQMLRKYGKTQQEVFLQADFPERFGYKLLSGEKHTKQRDYIIRICYAAGMDLEETQRALTLYGMAPLYARIPGMRC